MNEEIKVLSIEAKLGLNVFDVDKEPHITVDFSICETCEKKPCLYICPAKLYQLENGKLTYNYEGCLECGSCLIACDKKAVKWNYPKGGFGVQYRFG